MINQQLLVQHQEQKHQHEQRLLHIFTLFGTSIFHFVGGAQQGSTLVLLELSRGFHAHCTSATARTLWRQLTIANFTAENPRVFPIDKGPVTDDDISILMPGVECPPQHRWLAYHKICIAKLQWLQRMQVSCEFIANFLHASSAIWLPMLFAPGAVSLAEVTAGAIMQPDRVFSRNEVRFVTQAAPAGALPQCYLDIEDLERANQGGAVTITLDGGRVVLQEMRRIGDGTTSLFRLVPLGGDGAENDNGAIRYGEMRQAINRVLSGLPERRGAGVGAGAETSATEDRGDNGWVVRPMPSCYEMPLEVYLISKPARTEAEGQSIEVSLFFLFLSLPTVPACLLPHVHDDNAQDFIKSSPYESS